MFEIHFERFVLTKTKDKTWKRFLFQVCSLHDINFLTSFKNTLANGCYQQIALELF